MTRPIVETATLWARRADPDARIGVTMHQVPNFGRIMDLAEVEDGVEAVVRMTAFTVGMLSKSFGR